VERLLRLRRIHFINSQRQEAVYDCHKFVAAERCLKLQRIRLRPRWAAYFKIVAVPYFACVFQFFCLPASARFYPSSPPKTSVNAGVSGMATVCFKMKNALGKRPGGS
jgi:hypothetical protein